MQVETSFSKEDYVNVKDFKLRRALARLRTSAHNLAIERGRYTRPLTPLEERVCTTCSHRPVEDGYHYLMTCINYDEKTFEDAARSDKNDNYKLNSTVTNLYTY